MIRETAVEFVEKIVRSVSEYALRVEIGHSVGQVHRDAYIAVVPLVPEQEGEIVFGHVQRVHASPLGGDRGRTAFVYPLPDGLESRIIAHGTGVFGGHLHAVVLRSVVRRRNLYRGLETAVSGSEINRRGGGQAEVIYVGAGIGNAFEHCIVNLIG